MTEPARLRDATVPAVRYWLRYADGPHDAEVLLVDPRGNRLYVATKGLTGGACTGAPARPARDRVNLLQRGWPAPSRSPTPSPRRRRLRAPRLPGRSSVHTAPGRRVAFDLPLQLQGESITMSADGRSVLAGSEGPDSEVWRVPSSSRHLQLGRSHHHPRPAGRRPRRPAEPTGGSRRGGGGGPFLVMTAGALALVAAAVVVGRRRRP